MTAISIVPLAQTSQPQWQALWVGYQAFYQTKLSDELSAHTWQRLTSAESAHMYGFAALFEQCQRQFKTDPFYLTNGKVKLTPLISY